MSSFFSPPQALATIFDSPSAVRTAEAFILRGKTFSRTSKEVQEPSTQALTTTMTWMTESIHWLLNKTTAAHILCHSIFAPSVRQHLEVLNSEVQQNYEN